MKGLQAMCILSKLLNVRLYILKRTYWFITESNSISPNNKNRLCANIRPLVSVNAVCTSMSKSTWTDSDHLEASKRFGRKKNQFKSWVFWGVFASLFWLYQPSEIWKILHLLMHVTKYIKIYLVYDLIWRVIWFHIY